MAKTTEFKARFVPGRFIRWSCDRVEDGKIVRVVYTCDTEEMAQGYADRFNAELAGGRLSPIAR